MSSSRPIDNPKDPRTDEKPVFSKELVQEDAIYYLQPTLLSNTYKKYEQENL